MPAFFHGLLHLILRFSTCFPRFTCNRLPSGLIFGILLKILRMRSWFPCASNPSCKTKLNKFTPSLQICTLFKRRITLSTGKITSSSADTQENQSSSVATGQHFVLWIALSFQLGRIGQWNMAWRHLQMKMDERSYRIQLREQFQSLLRRSCSTKSILKRLCIARKAVKLESEPVVS